MDEVWDFKWGWGIGKELDWIYGGAFEGITDLAGITDGTIASAFSSALVGAETIYNVLFSLGAALSIAYYLLWLMKEASESRFNVEAMIKGLIKLFMAMWFMINAFNLLELAISLGSAVVVQMDSALGLSSAAGSSIPSELVNEINDATTWERLAYAVMFIFPAIAMTILKVYITMVCYMRIIELIVRVMFAPLAMGDIYSGGENPTAIRYFRSFLACCLQGSVIICTYYVYSLISGALSVDASIFATVVTAIAAGAFIAKSQSFAKELCGVG